MKSAESVPLCGYTFTFTLEDDPETPSTCRPTGLDPSILPFCTPIVILLA